MDKLNAEAVSSVCDCGQENNMCDQEQERQTTTQQPGWAIKYSFKLFKTFKLYVMSCQVVLEPIHMVSDSVEQQQQEMLTMTVTMSESTGGP